MPAGERRKHQLPRVGLALVDVHPRDVLIDAHQLRHIGKVQLRIHALRIEVERQRQQIRVARALTVAEQCALDAVCARQQPHFGIGNGAASVVVRVQRHHDMLPLVEVIAHILDLVGVDVRHGQRDRDRQVDDDRIFRRRLPDFEHFVADLGGEIHLRSGEGFRAVFKADVAARHHLAAEL